MRAEAQAQAGGRRHDVSGPGRGQRQRWPAASVTLYHPLSPEYRLAGVTRTALLCICKIRNTSFISLPLIDRRIDKKRGTAKLKCVACRIRMDRTGCLGHPVYDRRAADTTAPPGVKTRRPQRERASCRGLGDPTCPPRRLGRQRRPVSATLSQPGEARPGLGLPGARVNPGRQRHAARYETRRICHAKAHKIRLS